jgi:hypothetical protein
MDKLVRHAVDCPQIEQAKKFIRAIQSLKKRWQIADPSGPYESLRQLVRDFGLDWEQELNVSYQQQLAWANDYRQGLPWYTGEVPVDRDY